MNTRNCNNYVLCLLCVKLSISPIVHVYKSKSIKNITCKTSLNGLLNQRN